MASSMTSTRPATHAGSWYEADPSQLAAQIAQWLAKVPAQPRNKRFAVGPHAGYRFCGPVLAHTYAPLDSAITRVILMGPSHFKYFEGVRTTSYETFTTPIGDVGVDRAVVDAVIREADLQTLDIATDKKEHSWEMHLPFLRSVNAQAKVVPLLFGARSQVSPALAAVLAKYVSDSHTAFIVSSDFCHWGEYFDYMPFLSDAPLVYKQIEALDRRGMEVASTGIAADWHRYIQETGNTICGEKPIGFMLDLAASSGSPIHLEWLAYAQSSKARGRNDSSVSYAAGVF